jgi:hypothetical protein
MQRRQLLAVIGHDQVLHFHARGYRGSVARVVVAVAVCLIFAAWVATRGAATVFSSSC